MQSDSVLKIVLHWLYITNNIKYYEFLFPQIYHTAVFNDNGHQGLD